MFLQLNHLQFDVCKIARIFFKDCYELTKHFPSDEKLAMTQQIMRAALSVYLNISEGFLRRSEVERKRFFEISRGSLIEINAALDIPETLGYCKKEALVGKGTNLIRCFSMRSKLVRR